MRLEQVQESLKLATNYSLYEVTEDGYWCAEVHSNTTFTAGMYQIFPRSMVASEVQNKLQGQQKGRFTHVLLSMKD